MTRQWFRSPKALILIPLSLVLLVAVACGSAEQPATSVPAATSAPEVMAATTAAPEAMAATTAPKAKPTEAPAMAVEAVGAINYGIKESGIFEGHPRFISSPRIQYSAVTFGESMVAIQRDLSPGPMLATSWSISDDYVTWTWKLRKGVQFHKGYGEMTIEDVFYSYKNYHEGALLARAGIIGDFWLGNDGGSQEIVDDYTIKLNTGTPWVPARAFEMMLSGRDVSAAEAALIGLVSRTVPDGALQDEALDLADTINGWSTQGVALTKRMMWSGLETASLEAAIELESHTQLYVRLTTKNFEEATRARKEGRKPEFLD